MKGTESTSILPGSTPDAETQSARTLVTDVRLLRITDIQDNCVDWATVPGCEISEREIDQYRLGRGDILIARTGGTIGKAFLTLQPCR
jgi:hypothetical protein